MPVPVFGRGLADFEKNKKSVSKSKQPSPASPTLWSQKLRAPVFKEQLLRAYLSRLDHGRPDFDLGNRHVRIAFKVLALQFNRWVQDKRQVGNTLERIAIYRLERSVQS